MRIEASQYLMLHVLRCIVCVRMSYPLQCTGKSAPLDNQPQTPCPTTTCAPPHYEPNTHCCEIVL